MDKAGLYRYKIEKYAHKLEQLGGLRKADEWEWYVVSGDGVAELPRQFNNNRFRYKSESLDKIFSKLTKYQDVLLFFVDRAGGVAGVVTDFNKFGTNDALTVKFNKAQDVQPKLLLAHVVMHAWLDQLRTAPKEPESNDVCSKYAMIAFGANIITAALQTGHLNDRNFNNAYMNVCREVTNRKISRLNVKPQPMLDRNNAMFDKAIASTNEIVRGQVIDMCIVDHENDIKEALAKVSKRVDADDASAEAHMVRWLAANEVAPHLSKMFWQVMIKDGPNVYSFPPLTS